jgi:hypothetical protein
MSRHRSYYPPTNPATTEGWERVKTALAALRKHNFGAGHSCHATRCASRAAAREEVC